MVTPGPWIKTKELIYEGGVVSSHGTHCLCCLGRGVGMNLKLGEQLWDLWTCKELAEKDELS